jgi:hypothetical protein
MLAPDIIICKIKKDTTQHLLFVLAFPTIIMKHVLFIVNDIAMDLSANYYNRNSYYNLVPLHLLYS